MWSISLFLLGTSSIALAGVVPAQPVITPAPSLEDFELARRQNDVELESLLPLLMTAVPPSILALALTNVPAVSRLLWSEFLDSNTPAWFTALPTDVQQYLSGEFGPTTTASRTASTTPVSSAASTSSATSASPSALSSARGEGNTGLPLWAKIVIGIAVPLFVIGLITCVILCCCRRRHSRHRKAEETSRAPTPAFISSSNQRPHHSGRPVEHVPLRGGYHSSSPPDSNYHTSGSSRHLSSGSDDFRTPVGGSSYENMQPHDMAAAGATHPAHRTTRDSRQSLNSLHSVPEVPESMHHHHRHHGATDAMSVPPPPRSPRRSRDMSHEAALNNGTHDSHGRRISPLNPAYANSGGLTDRGMQPDASTAGQGIYAGHKNPYHNYDADYRPDNPFNDGYMMGGATEHNKEESHGRNTELFIPAAAYRDQGPAEPGYKNDNSWPLKNTHQGGYRSGGGGRARRNSWETGDDSPLYEM